MFRKNRKHEQPSLLSDIELMPEAQRKRLEESWAHAFREHCFSRIDEEIFAVLYSDVASRPNVAVNVLVGLEILKSGMGWSDAELYEAFLFDMQVRYALGYESLNDGYFAPRSLYHFRQRLSQHYQTQGVNLLEVAFGRLTDAQAQALKVKTKTVRMDSTQIASDIMRSSRLYLLVEGVRRLYRMLNEAEQADYAERCTPYVKRESEHYVYAIKDHSETERSIEAVGQLLHQMLSELQERYAQTPVYQTIERLFADNFHQVEETVTPKANQEIGSGALQSLDDLEATFRKKDGVSYKGYVANISESCDKENETQLILAVQVAPNNTDDATLLVNAMPDLVTRTEMETLYTDGGYGSDEADRVLNESKVAQIQTALRGNSPDPSKLGLADFTIEQDEEGKPTYLTCPQGHRVQIDSGRSTGFLARFDPALCAECPFHQSERCRAQPRQRDTRFTLSFTQEEVFRAKRRQRHRALCAEPGNPRAAVEATVRSVKHPFPHGKVPVRGLFRVTCMVIASAAMVNVRRIHRAGLQAIQLFFCWISLTSARAQLRHATREFFQPFLG